MSSAVLGLDTSGSWCSAALLRGPDRFARRAEVGNAHSSHLLAMIEAVLAEAEIALGDCAAIAFAAGPGSFTGLRVACAVTQGLAFGAGLRVAPIGTLDAIARSVARSEVDPPCSILVAQDARMGELYWTLLACDGDRLRTIIEPSLGSPVRMRSALAERRDGDLIAVGCGNAWSVHHDALQGLVTRVVHRASADAEDVAWLGRIALDEQRLVDAELAAPVYVRNDVAMTSVQRAERARALAQAA